MRNLWELIVRTAECDVYIYRDSLSFSLREFITAKGGNTYENIDFGSEVATDFAEEAFFLTIAYQIFAIIGIEAHCFFFPIGFFCSFTLCFLTILLIPVTRTSLKACRRNAYKSLRSRLLLWLVRNANLYPHNEVIACPVLCDS